MYSVWIYSYFVSKNKFVSLFLDFNEKLLIIIIA